MRPTIKRTLLGLVGVLLAVSATADITGPVAGQSIFSGALPTTATTTGVAAGQSGGSPDLQFINSSGGTNSKVWDCYADPTTFHCRFINDTFASQQDWLQVLRNQMLVTSVTIPQGNLVLTLGALQVPVTTVAALPSCGTGQKGELLAVSDATTPTYNGALTGGGAVSVPVYCNGSTWTSH